MAKDSGHALESLAVDGGMSNSSLCMQTQADIIGIPVDRPLMRETTALGAAIAAGFAVGIWQHFGDVKKINTEDRTIFVPNPNRKKYQAMFRKWEQAVEMSKGWVLDSDEDSSSYSDTEENPNDDASSSYSDIEETSKEEEDEEDDDDDEGTKIV